MGGRFYFLLTSLPALPTLGEAPPMELGVFRELVRAEPAAATIVDALLLEHDLLLREGVLAGEVSEPEAVVLSAEEVRGEAPLPEYLSFQPARAPRIGADAVWEGYYRYVDALGLRRRCDFLRRWVGFEVALRNAVARVRAEALELDPAGYLLAEDLAREESAAGEAAEDVASAADPLGALRAMDVARWQWLEDASGYFSFAIDELAAYARRLVLLTRWHVIARQGEEDRSGRSEANR